MPARLSDIVRAAKKQGAHCEEPSSGSHWKLYKDEFMYTIPAHNGPKSEISDVYIKKACKQLGLNYALLMSDI